MPVAGRSRRCPSGRAMYEHRRLPLASRASFRRRFLRHAAVAGIVMTGSLLVGMAGYAWFEGLGWCDAFLNAAMLLGGMGPVEAPKTQAGKLFAGTYALYAGLVFIVTAGILVTPIAHRMLHRFHGEEDEEAHRGNRRRT